MAKTRNQTKNITIKKEEEEKEEKEEEDCKRILDLGNAGNTRNKITKRQPSKRNNRRLPVQQVKVEEDSDTKALLQISSKHSKLAKRQSVSQEQINQLIDYVVNHGMNVRKAARKANIAPTTAHDYYTDYKNDPEKKIPLPRNQRALTERFLTQEQVENLIRYIVDDKMSISKASAKANIACYSGRYYYKKYLQDPNRNIPIRYSQQMYTQDQKNELIGYIVNDKMSINAASRKAKMNHATGSKYYHEYFKDQHPDIPTPSHITSSKHLTQEQIKEVIRCIVSDKMTMAAASRKVNVDPSTARKYYRQYLKDNNMELPVSNRYTQDEINEFIGYIIDDKMSIAAASRKANINPVTIRNYYRRYLKDNNMEIPVSKFRKRYTQEQINKFIGHIVDDKMTVKAASKKANVSYTFGSRYYKQYLMDHNLDVYIRKSITQDQKDELIGSVEKSKHGL